MKLGEMVREIARTEPQRYIYIGGAGRSGGWAVMETAGKLDASWEEVNADVRWRTCRVSKKTYERLANVKKLVEAQEEILRNPEATRVKRIEYITTQRLPALAHKIRYHEMMLKEGNESEAMRKRRANEIARLGKTRETNLANRKTAETLNGFVKENERLLQRYRAEVKSIEKRIANRSKWEPLEECEVKDVYTGILEPYPVMIVVSHKMPKGSRWGLWDDGKSTAE